MHVAPSVMDDQLCSPLDNCDRFRFKDMFEVLNYQPLEVVPSPPQYQYHPASTSEAPSRIPFTPDPSRKSPILPIQPFTFPHMSDPAPFPSLAADWFHSSESIPMPNLNPSHFYAPLTWDENYIPTPFEMSDGNYGVAYGVAVTPSILDPLAYGPSYRGFGIDEIPQTKGKVNFQPLRGSDIQTPTTARPKRTERPCKRLAPYKIDKGHEGVRKKNLMSQLEFLYENPGHNDNVSKRLTKR